MTADADEIKQKNKTLSGLRKEQGAHDKALEEARAKQAKARSEVLATEKKSKKAEKALEGRVRHIGFPSHASPKATVTETRLSSC